MSKEYYLYVNGQRVKVSEQIYKVYWREKEHDDCSDHRYKAQYLERYEDYLVIQRCCDILYFVVKIQMFAVESRKEDSHEAYDE